MKHRITTDECGRIEDAWGDTALYEWACRTAYAYAPQMPHLNPRPEEIYTLLVESFDELRLRMSRGFPESAWWLKPRYELAMACMNGNVPDEELDKAVAVTLSLLLICVMCGHIGDEVEIIMHLTEEIQAHSGASEAVQISACLADLSALVGSERIATEVITYMETGHMTACPPEWPAPDERRVNDTAGNDENLARQMVENALKRDDVSELKALKLRLYDLENPSATAPLIAKINGRISALSNPLPTTQNVFQPGANQINQSTLQNPTFGTSTANRTLKD